MECSRSWRSLASSHRLALFSYIISTTFFYQAFILWKTPLTIVAAKWTSHEPFGITGATECEAAGAAGQIDEVLLVAARDVLGVAQGTLVVHVELLASWLQDILYPSMSAAVTPLARKSTYQERQLRLPAEPEDARHTRVIAVGRSV